MRQAGQLLAVLCGLALVVALCGCGGNDLAGGSSVDATASKPPPPPPPPPPTPGKIVFDAAVKVGKRNSVTSVRTMNTNGTGIVTLVPGAHAAWSPDRSKIAYAGDYLLPDGRTTSCIYTVNADGTGGRQVTTPARYTTQWWDDMSTDSEPAWSPDGSQIVFTRGVLSQGYPLSIQTIGSTGGTPTLVVEVSPSTDNMLFCPKWSAGNRIAFYGGAVSGGYHVDVVNADGTDRRLLLADARYPAWSPTGSKLALNRVGADQGLWVGDYDAGTNTLSNLTRLTSTGIDIYPTWSPDGQEIAFQSYSGSRYDIYKVNAADGSGRTCLTASDAYGGKAPDWSTAP
jgi:Tol biopolymer transport system component